MLNMAEPDRILADAREARRRGADVVIVRVHWGDEYVHEPSQESSARWRARSPPPRRGRGDRPARARGAADPARERQAGGLRRGQPALQPDGQLLPGWSRRTGWWCCSTCASGPDGVSVQARALRAHLGRSTRASRWCARAASRASARSATPGAGAPWLRPLRLGSARHADPRRRSRGVRQAARGPGRRARRARARRGARAPGRLRRVPHRPLHGQRRRPVGLRPDRARPRGRRRGRGRWARA